MIDDDTDTTNSPGQVIPLQKIALTLVRVILQPATEAPHDRLIFSPRPNK